MQLTMAQEALHGTGLVGKKTTAPHRLAGQPLWPPVLSSAPREEFTYFRFTLETHVCVCACVVCVCVYKHYIT